MKIPNTKGLYENIVKDCPQLKRGLVWCKQCGSELRVDAIDCLKSGWPICCNVTMTIDHPDTWNKNND